MNEQIHIREATVSDIDAILEIEDLSFDSDGFNKKQLVYLICKASGVFYVIEVQNKIAGYLSSLTHSGRNNLRMYSLAIHPRERGKHLSSLLIDKAIDFAKQRYLKYVSLEVNIHNTPAIRTYEKHGFTKTGLRKNYYHDHSDAYVMTLFL